jgi:inositol oxygenase
MSMPVSDRKLRIRTPVSYVEKAKRKAPSAMSATRTTAATKTKGPGKEKKPKPSTQPRGQSYGNSTATMAFRDYGMPGARTPLQLTVENHYRLMRTHQTVAFVNKMHEEFCRFDHADLTVQEAFDILEEYVDSAEPDFEFPNAEHNFQTAEAARVDGAPDWLQLVALMHDVGKIQFKWGCKEHGQEPQGDGDQWSLGGDTWVVGCQIPDSVVFPEFNDLNPDMKSRKYNTKHGMYESKCGLYNLKMAWGHDEYGYQVLKNHTEKLKAANHPHLIPDEGLDIIRYHSCYPWHTEHEYSWATTHKDDNLKHAVLRFNKYDLYTKKGTRPDMKALWPYYQTLIDKYLPGKISF